MEDNQNNIESTTTAPATAAAPVSTATATTPAAPASTTTAAPATTGGYQGGGYQGGGAKPRYERKPYNRDFDGNKDGRKRFFKRKVCNFCKNRQEALDYKDVRILKRYIKDSGKIIPKRLTGTCSKHQRMVTRSIKRARSIALLPYETRY